MEEVEEWRPIAGFDSQYEISSIGRVRRLVGGHRTYAGRLLKSSPKKPSSYHIIRLLDAKNIRLTRYVHRLVVETFRGPIGSGLEVNHIDGDKNNNRLSNLELVSRREHYEHAVSSGQNTTVLRGEKNASAKLTVQDVLAIRRKSGTIPTVTLAREYGVSFSTIRRIVLRQYWGHV